MQEDNNDIDNSTHMDDQNNEEESQYLSVSPTDQLERCGRWLSSIPRDDVIILRQTPEYQEFMRSFERLGRAHRRVISTMNNNHDAVATMEDAATVPNIAISGFDFHPDWILNNFLQHLTADDVVLRIFEFLECHSLIRTALTCSRFRQLGYKSATQRTVDVTRSRQLSNVMQLLRAKEQIDGVGNGLTDSHVRVPILLLSRRVLVTGSGDPEFNGVYFCTGSNGNGFVFTKPRYPERRVQRRAAVTTYLGGNPPIVAGGGAAAGQPNPQQQRNFEPNGDIQVGRAAVAGRVGGGGPQTHLAARFESEVARPGQLLRCILAKRFSNETILWYMSKEVETTDEPMDGGGVAIGEVTQVFAFWSKLMVIGDASPDICRYPSQSSILARHNEGWQSLSTTRTIRPPTVELLD